jgi:hypothetical protein
MRGLVCEGVQFHQVFNLSHRNLCHNASEIKGDLQRAFQTVFEYGHVPDIGQLLTHLGYAIYDIEDLEYTFEHFNIRYGRPGAEDGYLYVVVLDLPEFVDALIELLEVVEEVLFCEDEELTEDRVISCDLSEIVKACVKVRSAATRMKYITTPVKPGVNELCYNDQD